MHFSFHHFLILSVNEPRDPWLVILKVIFKYFRSRTQLSTMRDAPPNSQKTSATVTYYERPESVNCTVKNVNKENVINITYDTRLGCMFRLILRVIP